MAAADYRLMTEATGQRIAIALENLAGFGNYLTSGDVVNDLTSGGTTVPLSAEMGKTLNDNKENKIVWTTVTLSYASATALENRNVNIPTGKSVYLTIIGSINYDNVSIKVNTPVMRVGNFGFRIQGSGFTQSDTLDIDVGWY